MDEKDKMVDLAPYEWSSEREKPKEPFFGPGLGWFIELMVIAFFLTLFVHYCVRGN